MTKVADELDLPVSKYPRKLALPVLIPRATLPPQFAIWSIIILISLNCISKGLEKRKAVFLSMSLGCGVSLFAPQRASTGGGNMTPAPVIPSSSWSFFLFPFFLPHQLLRVMWTETYRKYCLHNVKKLSFSTLACPVLGISNASCWKRPP